MARARARRCFFAGVFLLGLCATAQAAGADACAGSATQAEMNRCAHEEFEAASAVYAERYRELSQALPSAQRDRLRRMQGAWLQFRTEACRFESGPATGGSVREFVYWRCVSRMTRERAAALQALAVCSEGDVGCTRRAR